MQSWLPSGWTYYAKLNEFQLGETQDFWSLEHGFLVRHYVLGPSSTFTFDRETLQGMLVPVSSLQKYKITNPDANMGRPLLKSISAEATNISSDGWLGMTMFPLAKEASSTSTRRSTSPRGQVMRPTEQHGWHLWSPRRRRTTRLILESQK